EAGVAAGGPVPARAAVATARLRRRDVAEDARRPQGADRGLSEPPALRGLLRELTAPAQGGLGGGAADRPAGADREGPQGESRRARLGRVAGPRPGAARPGNAGDRAATGVRRGIRRGARPVVPARESARPAG